MTQNQHERAIALLTVARVESIGPREQQWLEEHLAGCAECSNEAQGLASSIDALRSFSVTAPPATVRRTMLAVHLRIEQRRVQRDESLPLWIAIAVSTLLVIVTTPYTWWAFAWMGRVLDVPAAVWQATFLMWWFMPATVVSAVTGW